MNNALANAETQSDIIAIECDISLKYKSVFYLFPEEYKNIIYANDPIQRIFECLTKGYMGEDPIVYDVKIKNSSIRPSTIQECKRIFIESGIRILQKYDSNIRYKIIDDVVYCGNFTKISKVISPIDKEALETIGWHQHEKQWALSLHDFNQKHHIN